MELTISKEFRFEASHVLPRHPGKCSRLHGHSWVLHVAVRGPVDSQTGFVKDYALLKEAIQPLIDRLDHQHLGAWDIQWTGLDLSPNWFLSYSEAEMLRWGVKGMLKDFYPSSENLLVWIGYQLLPKVDWSELSLNETCTSRAVLRREDFERELSNKG